MFGEKSLFLTGTDEHGQKVERAAKARGMDPKAHCDDMVVHFKNIWKELQCDYDIFMRTTEGFHAEGVQESLQFLFDKGDIYEKTYEGWYSVSEEIFYTESELIDGKSPTGKEVTKVAEQNYFFRMSKYQDALLKHIEANPDFIRPDHKKSEVIGFLKQPLGDLCISRPKERLSWGIEIPFDKNFVTYVWFDALLNYATAIGYRGPKKTSEKYNEFWPSVIHLIGKDILITHTVYWTTMLLALEQPLPRCIFAHGWWLTGDNKKMSKSEGPVVKPLDLREEVGVDGLRYFLARDVVLGNDAQFSRELVITRLNAELANNLGNLLSRTINLISKYFDGVPPSATETSQHTKDLRDLILKTPEKVKHEAFNLAPHAAIGEVVSLLSAANKYIDTMAPWKLAKEDIKLAGECLSAVYDVLRVAAALLNPVMPGKTKELFVALGYEESVDALTVIKERGKGKVALASPLFPRLNADGV